MRRPFFALLALNLALPLAHARGNTEPAPNPPSALDAGTSVYQKTVRSTVWVHSDRGGGRVATGSGALVDRGRRLVLTNYHVVGNVKAATVYFPEFEGRKTIPDRKYYLDRVGRLGVRGEVVELDKQADLALIRLDRVPDGVPELPLAADSPDPGQAVHSIGNPGKSGALWVYTPGKVRQVYGKRWKAKLDEKTVATFEAKVIETDSPTNPGDSGGPLVNDRGQLVGVTQGGTLDAQSISLFVDLSEVKRLMNRRSVQLLRSEAAAVTTRDDNKEPPKKDAPKREKALESKDEGKFFSEAAWKRVGPDAERLLKEKGIDFVIETVVSPPNGDPEKLAAMKPAERTKFFQQYAAARAKELNLKGVYVFVSKAPATLFVHMSESADLPKDFGPKLRAALIESFTAKKFDDGLNKVLDMTLDAKGLGAKK